MGICILLSQVLRLIRHQLKDIHQDVFTAMHRLKQLYILDGKLTTMPPLYQISRSLEALLLDGNDISDAGIRFKDDFPMLKTLGLCRNRLTHFPNLGRIAGQLETLDLSFNCMESLQNLYKFDYFNLSYLYLSNNYLKHISLSNMRMPLLKALYMKDNLLLTLETVDNLELVDGTSGECGDFYIELGDNPWHCNESLAWLYKGLENHMLGNTVSMAYRGTSCTFYISDVRFITCKTPKQYSGKDLKTVGK